jgi:glycosyltransferase involved in cell wall biosynthesis
VSLTIGMATYRDFDGVYFTVQSLRLYHDLSDCELLVVDNCGDQKTRQWCEKYGVRYARESALHGTAYPRQKIFELAACDYVLVLDCHVLLAPDAVRRLKLFFDTHPDTPDLLQGPLLGDDLNRYWTHLRDEWDLGMWGKWASDPRGAAPSSPPFEVPMQGLGCFACRKDAWVGFNPHFQGFGGEEGYTHLKFKRRGARTLCLPWLRWAHRFTPRGEPTPYRNDWIDRLMNYAIGFTELGLDLDPVRRHFTSIGFAADLVERAVLAARHRVERKS